MKWYQAILSLLILVVWSSSDAAFGIDGNAFLEMSDTQKGAYMAGLIDGMEGWAVFAMSESASRFGPEEDSAQMLMKSRRWLIQCTRDRSHSQLLAIFEKYLNENPERWHLSASSLYFDSLTVMCANRDW